MRKRKSFSMLLALTLSLIMLSCLLPTAALAAEPGDGEETSRIILNREAVYGATQGSSLTFGALIYCPPEGISSWAYATIDGDCWDGDFLLEINPGSISGDTNYAAVTIRVPETTAVGEYHIYLRITQVQYIGGEYFARDICSDDFLFNVWEKDSEIFNVTPGEESTIQGETFYGNVTTENHVWGIDPELAMHQDVHGWMNNDYRTIEDVTVNNLPGLDIDATLIIQDQSTAWINIDTDNIPVGKHRISVTCEGITSEEFDIVVTEHDPDLSDDTDLSSLSVSLGTLSPAFHPDVAQYHVELPLGTESVIISAVANDPKATIWVAGKSSVDGVVQAEIDLTEIPEDHSVYVFIGVYAENGEYSSCHIIFELIPVELPHTHLEDGGTITRDATCELDGIKTFKCIHCDEILREERVAKLGHSWNGGVVTTPPTQDAFGEMTFTCLRCGDTYTESIPKLPVTPDDTNAAFLQERADEVLQKGLSKDNLRLSGKTLTLVLDGREFVLSTNAKNRNVSGEIDLGDGYYLKFDIKGNGSNVKQFKVIQK